MQVLKDVLFYSNNGAGFNEVVDDDWELLVLEQKVCRARARQYCLETNRRRKALEDRKKQWDVQEQRLRENILLQRKQKLHEATERFQRAHLPPSQRRRAASVKRALNLDEALSNIQGAPSSYSHPPLFNGFPVSRSCTPSTKPQGGLSGPPRLRGVSAAQAYVKLMHDFKTSQSLFINQLQETETPLKDLEKLRPHRHTNPAILLQENRDTPVSPTESLSSLDSLENKVSQQDHNHKHAFLDQPEIHDTGRSSSPLKPLNCSSPSSNLCLTKSFSEGVLSQHGQQSFSSSLSSSPRENDSIDEDQRVLDLSNASDQSSVTYQTQASNTKSTSSCQSVQSKQMIAANSGFNTWHNIEENNVKDTCNMLTHCEFKTVQDTVLQVSNLNQESLYLHSKDFAKCINPQETQATLQILDTAYDVPPSSENLQQIEAHSAHQLSKTNLDTGVAKVSELGTKLKGYEKFKRLDQANLSNELSNKMRAKSSKTTEQPEKTSEQSNNNLNFKTSNVHFLKGILKNKAKCVRNGDLKITYTTGHFAFNKQVAMAIRDSLELAKDERRDPESNKSMKKRLRWFDEVHIDGEESEERLKKEANKQSNAKNKLTRTVDQQQVSDHFKIPKTNTDSSGLTKQAWSNAFPQEWSELELNEKSRKQIGGPHVNGHCIPHQMFSAKIVSCPVSSQTRRGTVIRTQSATEMQNVVRTKGKLMTPRPPPRSEVTKSNSGPVYATRTTNNSEHSRAKPGPAAGRVFYKEKPVGHICAPVPSPYAYPYESTKGVHTLCQAENQIRCSKNGFHNGFCLDRTPTDEEISLLWNGVRSALTSKDARCPMRRPSLESNMVKSRTYVDHSRSKSGTRGDRTPHIFHQASMPADGHSSKTEQIVQEGSDEQVFVNSSHLQRASLIQQSQRGLTNLSLEEQQLLQSLDRLNHRLQHVQDMAAGNTALKGVATVDSAYNKSPQPNEVICATLRRYHSGPSDSRASSQKHY